MSWRGYLVPTDHRRANECVGLLLLTMAILSGLSLISFNPDDPSLNISKNPLFDDRPANFIGFAGAYTADSFFQLWGYSAFLDRKSTRLNSSHTVISYAVFCLKKKIFKLI